MSTIKIALCGSPLSGKRSLVERLAGNQKNQLVTEEELENGERLLTLDLNFLFPREFSESEQVFLQTSSGSLFDEKRIIIDILRDASFVLYALAAPEPGPPIDFQLRCHSRHRQYATNLGQHPDDWTYLLTKADSTNLQTNNISDYDAISGKNLTPCSAHSGMGIDLLEKIIREATTRQMRV